MREELITLETAKLAKEKGFDWCVLFGYKPDGSRVDYDIEGGYYNYNQLDQENLSAPTQALLQRWLREVHNIDVYCIPWIYENKRVYDFFVNYEGESRAYSSYEKALEVGLQEALKLIKTSHL